MKDTIKALVGSGDRIGRLVLPFLVTGLALNILWPAWFAVGGPAPVLRTLSLVMLVPGVVMWAWSVVLIITRVPRGELITSGPFSLVKHPLYTGVSLLVLPWLGFLLNSWLGLALGIVLYAAARRYEGAEEESLAREFGPAWDDYRDRVLIGWL
jgi:protein-S-isoprenylcysteine O-methyltransferase Ste14